MAVATDGDSEFVLVGVTHHGHDVLSGARPEDGGGHAMEQVAFVPGDRTAGLLIEQQRAIELRQAIERAGLLAPVIQERASGLKPTMAAPTASLVNCRRESWSFIVGS